MKMSDEVIKTSVADNKPPVATASNEAATGISGGGGGGSRPNSGSSSKKKVKKSASATCVDGIKKIIQFIISNIGLVIMVILYSMAGGFLFKLLEAKREILDCSQGRYNETVNIENLKSEILMYMQYNYSSNPNDLDKDNETVANQKIEKMLVDFGASVIELKGTYRYDGQDCENDELKWNFANSLLFAITVITTIGYGNIAPVTWEGQISCICYATIGIPLFLMCIANLSGILGDMFRFLYSRVCCYFCLKKFPMGAKTDKTDENNQDETKFEGDGVKKETGSGDEEASIAPPPALSKMIEDDDDDEEEEKEKVTVPLTITMIIITFYLLMGAVLFNYFEGWGMIASAYFCYITLSTIGFGDFVPGQREGDPAQVYKLTVGAIYLLFGMAILAMCFDLMQEEIIAKFTWLGKKFGIMNKDDDGERTDDDEDDTNKNEDKKPASATAGLSDKSQTVETF